MKLVAVTIGFDEKLPLRGLLKVGLDSSDVVLLVYSKTGGEFEVRKVEKAVEAFKDVVSRAGARVVDVVISGTDFYGDTVTVLEALKKHEAREVVAVLAGGMRITVFEVLTALLLHYRHGGVEAKVFLAREDGLYDVTLPVSMFYVSVTSRDNVVLKKLSEGGVMKRSRIVDEVSRETGISESMLYKVVKSLARRGLVVIEDDSVKLTELGRLTYEAIRKN